MISITGDVIAADIRNVEVDKYILSGYYLNDNVQSFSQLEGTYDYFVALNDGTKLKLTENSAYIIPNSIELKDIYENNNLTIIEESNYNLYGIEFDSRLLMGRDIFSDSEHIVILSDRSWITEAGRYNSVTRKFTKTTEEEIDDDYIDRINSIVNNRFSMSALILDNNYYKKVGLK